MSHDLSPQALRSQASNCRRSAETVVLEQREAALALDARYQRHDLMRTADLLEAIAARDERAAPRADAQSSAPASPSPMQTAYEEAQEWAGARPPPLAAEPTAMVCPFTWQPDPQGRDPLTSCVLTFQHDGEHRDRLGREYRASALTETKDYRTLIHTKPEATAAAVGPAPPSAFDFASWVDKSAKQWLDNWRKDHPVPPADRGARTATPAPEAERYFVNAITERVEARLDGYTLHGIRTNSVEAWQVSRLVYALMVVLDEERAQAQREKAE